MNRELLRIGISASLALAITPLAPAETAADLPERLGSLHDGLIARYSFDSIAELTVRDDSGKGSPGRLIAPIKTVPGVLGQALEFDGRELHMILGGSILGGRKTFSLSFWVKTTETRTAPNPPSCPTLIGLATLGLGSGDFGIVSNKGELVFWEGLDRGDRSHSSRHRISDNKWHHVVLVSDASKGLTIHLDGVQVIATTPPVNPVSRSAFAVGGSIFHGAYRFHHRGAMDELMFWDRALTATEISRLRALRYR